MEDKELTGEESLKLIREMIGEAKSSYISKGVASMVWGALIMLCSLISWAHVHYNFELWFDVWLLLIVALAIQIFFNIREGKSRKFTDRLHSSISYVWSTFGICIFMITYYQNVIPVQHPLFLYMLLYGIPTFITGGIFKHKPMIIGGISCWILAIISLYTNYETNLLLMAASGLLAWLIPGILLWVRYSRSKKNHV